MSNQYNNILYEQKIKQIIKHLDKQDRVLKEFIKEITALEPNTPMDSLIQKTYTDGFNAAKELTTNTINTIRQDLAAMIKKNKSNV